jgi:hypothetical protein
MMAFASHAVFAQSCNSHSTHRSAIAASLMVAGVLSVIST